VSRFALGLLAGTFFGNDPFTKILLHMDGANGGTTFADANVGGSAHTWTAHTATTNTGTAEFGTASLNCGAAAGSIDTPDHADFTLGSSDWTCDFWFNTQGGAGTTRRACGQADVGGGIANTSILCGLNGSDQAQMLVCQGGTAIIVSSTTTFVAAGWHHLAAVRIGNVLLLFIDGVQEGTAAFTGAVNDSTGSFAIGAGGLFPTTRWNGFIDEFRLSVGVARWTANFSPPTGPYF
jgi:hypothetical protein